jgi:hypothetical protein
MSIHVATSIPWYILANSFSLFVSVLAIIFVEIVLWSGRNGSRNDAIFVATEYGKSANRSLRFINKNDQKHQILYNYKCLTKEVVIFYHTGIYFAVSLRFCVLNRGSVLNGLPDVCQGCRLLNPMFMNYFWQQCVIGVRDALRHLVGLLCRPIKFREDILIINVARPVLLEFAKLADSPIYPPSSILNSKIKNLKKPPPHLISENEKDDHQLFF